MASGKSRKRKSGGPEAAERKRQRLDQRRQEKAEAQARQRKAEARARVVSTIGIVALIGVAFWFFFLRTKTPDEIMGHPITGFGGSGVGDHTTEPVGYEMTPPVQGSHANGPGSLRGPFDTRRQRELSSTASSMVPSGCCSTR